MSNSAEDVLASRAVRDMARATFDARLALMRGETEETGVGGRVKESISGEAKNALDEAIEIANHNRAVVAGTFGALMLWLFRNPIIAWLEPLFASADDLDEFYDEDDDDRDDTYEDY